MGALNVKPIYDIDIAILDFLSRADKVNLCLANRIKIYQLKYKLTGTNLFTEHFNLTLEKSRYATIVDIKTDVYKVYVTYLVTGDSEYRTYALNLKGLETYTMSSVNGYMLDAPVIFNFPKVTPKLQITTSVKTQPTYLYAMKTLKVDEPELKQRKGKKYQKRRPRRLVNKLAINHEKTHVFDLEYYENYPYGDQGYDVDDILYRSEDERINEKMRRIYGDY